MFRGSAIRIKPNICSILFGVAQLSFYSAEASPPRVADLAGLLCGPGQTVSFGRGAAARLSIVVAQAWRANALVAACAERAVDAELAVSEGGRPLVRTAFRADLTGLSSQWLRGAVKSVPSGFVLDGLTLRMWVLAAGRTGPSGYVLGLDPHHEQTHQPLVEALGRAGVSTSIVGIRGAGPAVRVTGARRLARLAELVGVRPAGVPETEWPVDPAAVGRRGAARRRAALELGTSA